MIDRVQLRMEMYSLIITMKRKRRSLHLSTCAVSKVDPGALLSTFRKSRLVSINTFSAQGIFGISYSSDREMYLLLLEEDHSI